MTTLRSSFVHLATCGTASVLIGETGRGKTTFIRSLGGYTAIVGNNTTGQSDTQAPEMHIVGCGERYCDTRGRNDTSRYSDHNIQIDIIRTFVAARVTDIHRVVVLLGPTTRALPSDVASLEFAASLVGNRMENVLILVCGPSDPILLTGPRALIEEHARRVGNHGATLAAYYINDQPVHPDIATSGTPVLHFYLNQTENNQDSLDRIHAPTTTIPFCSIRQRCLRCGWTGDERCATDLCHPNVISVHPRVGPSISHYGNRILTHPAVQFINNQEEPRQSPFGDVAKYGLLGLVGRHNFNPILIVPHLVHSVLAHQRARQQIATCTTCGQPANSEGCQMLWSCCRSPIVGEGSNSGCDSIQLCTVCHAPASTEGCDRQCQSCNMLASHTDFIGRCSRTPHDFAEDADDSNTL